MVFQCNTNSAISAQKNMQSHLHFPILFDEVLGEYVKEHKSALGNVRKNYRGSPLIEDRCCAYGGYHQTMQ